MSFDGIGVKFYCINILNYCLDLLEIIRHTTSLLVFGFFVSLELGSFST